ncbi:MAG: AAA family ATPase [Bacteroidetes bacterium]|nr:AAA family ATPase [Bacteroidota bacterium]
METGENRYRNIADFGSGINQLLPLFIIGGASNKNDLLIVEEPESNLHPNYQSKLADVFTVLQKEREMNFIIETHSEYMVRRFQYLVAKGKIAPEDIIINYFWIDNGVHKCKQIEFKSNGGLSKPFEPGFYEESLQQQLELLKINSLN